MGLELLKCHVSSASVCVHVFFSSYNGDASQTVKAQQSQQEIGRSQKN